MIVRDVMSTKLMTVEPNDTLGHAANIFRQYQFHHLPVVRTIYLPPPPETPHAPRRTKLLLEGMLTTQDIDVAAGTARQESSSEMLGRPWQERHVSEVMHRALIRVSPTTSVAAAAQIMVERGLNYLPVVEYEESEQETRTILVGLITRSDLLMALARALGAFEPGMQLEIALPLGDMKPLAETLRFVSELHTPIRSLIVAPVDNTGSQNAVLRLGTINPAPLLARLKEAGIHYSFATPLVEDDSHA